MPASRTLLLGSSWCLVPLYPGQACRTKVRLPANIAYRRGTVLMERISQPGVYYAYDGSYQAKLLLEFDCATDANGQITQGSLTFGSNNVLVPKASAFWTGTFNTQELVGLDDQALHQLRGTLNAGNLSNGILRLP
jgi:hypothetical protein